MNPNDLKHILDALTTADVREFTLRTGSFDLNLKRGPQPVVGSAPAPSPVMAAPLGYAAPMPGVPAPAGLAAPNTTEAETPKAETPKPAEASRAAATAETKPAANGTPVKAPIVGTFYEASSPEAAPYVKVGDSVKAGQVLCIIEAMKLMNEIEAEQGGVVREILVKNAEPVEYGQTLFVIE